MLTLEDATKKTNETRQAYAATKRANEAFWTLACAYDSGRQWAWNDLQFSKTVLRALRPITDPSREDVRVTMNLIHKDVRQCCAALAPAKIACHCEQATGDTVDLNVADLGDKMMDAWLPRIGGLQILREKERTRAVTGTAIVRRCLSASGMTKKVRRPDGSDGGIRDFDYRWSQVYPWEIVRDPSAMSTQPARDEELWIHEKPRSADWVRRYFQLDLKTDTTMGNLSDFQGSVLAAYGLTSGMSQSEVKAVLWGETYFKDPDVPDADWPWLLFWYLDPTKSGSDVVGHKLIRNPFYGLPFHLFTYDENVQAAWGYGIPHAQLAAQDLCNLAWTSVLRVMQAGNGKWAIEDGTMEKPIRMDNDIRKPIIWKRSESNRFANLAAAPTRIPPPQISSIAGAVLNLVPAWMQRAINTSDILSGITSKRGESGAAIEAKIGQAGQVLDQQRRTDDLEYQALLFGSLMDLCHPARMRLDTTRKLVGTSIPEQQILMAIRRPMRDAVKAVVLVSSQVHPQTPGEVQDSVVAMANAKLIDAPTAGWVLLEAGVGINPSQADSVRKQKIELQLMIEGQKQVVGRRDNNEWHLHVIDQFIDSPAWLSIPQDARDRINDHAALHELSQMQRQQLTMPAANGSQPDQQYQQGQPSPSASAVEAVQDAGAGGAATPAIVAAA